MFIYIYYNYKTLHCLKKRRSEKPALYDIILFVSESFAFMVCFITVWTYILYIPGGVLFILRQNVAISQPRNIIANKHMVMVSRR